MLGLSRWTEKGGTFGRSVQRFFYMAIPAGVGMPLRGTGVSLYGLRPTRQPGGTRQRCFDSTGLSVVYSYFARHTLFGGFSHLSILSSLLAL